MPVIQFSCDRVWGYRVFVENPTLSVREMEEYCVKQLLTFLTLNNLMVLKEEVSRRKYRIHDTEEAFRGGGVVYICSGNSNHHQSRPSANQEPTDTSSNTSSHEH